MGNMLLGGILGGVEWLISRHLHPLAVILPAPVSCRVLKRIYPQSILHSCCAIRWCLGTVYWRRQQRALLGDGGVTIANESADTFIRNKGQLDHMKMLQSSATVSWCSDT